MSINITLNYQLTNSDFIEAKQLNLIRSRSAWLNLIFSYVFVLYTFIDLTKISDRDLSIFDYLKEFFLSNDVQTNYIFSALFSFGMALLISSNTFPKYNPIYRWTFFKKYQKNFINGEIINVAIDDNKIAIKSTNYRELRQWQDFSQFKENKSIFLLYSSQNKTIIIPKRVFKNPAQIENMRLILNYKIS